MNQYLSATRGPPRCRRGATRRCRTRRSWRRSRPSAAGGADLWCVWLALARGLGCHHQGSPRACARLTDQRHSALDTIPYFGVLLTLLAKTCTARWLIASALCDAAGNQPCPQLLMPSQGTLLRVLPLHVMRGTSETGCCQVFALFMHWPRCRAEPRAGVGDGRRAVREAVPRERRPGREAEQHRHRHHLLQGQGQGVDPVEPVPPCVKTFEPLQPW